MTYADAYRELASLSYKGWSLDEAYLDEGAYLPPTVTDQPLYCTECGRATDIVETTMFGGPKAYMRWCTDGCQRWHMHLGTWTMEEES